MRRPRERKKPRRLVSKQVSTAGYETHSGIPHSAAARKALPRAPAVRKPVLQEFHAQGSNQLCDNDKVRPSSPFPNNCSSVVHLILRSGQTF